MRSCRCSKFTSAIVEYTWSGFLMIGLDVWKVEGTCSKEDSCPICLCMHDHSQLQNRHCIGQPACHHLNINQAVQIALDSSVHSHQQLHRSMQHPNLQKLGHLLWHSIAWDSSLLQLLPAMCCFRQHLLGTHGLRQGHHDHDQKNTCCCRDCWQEQHSADLHAAQQMLRVLA